MAISYAELDSNYPTTQHPCGDGWENQCAIRMSLALEGAGFSLSDYTDPKCSHGHARGAESLANHLWKTLGRPQIFTGSGAKSSLLSKRGIVFFKDIAGFRNGTGDHIDCWNGTSTKTGEYFSYCKQVWFFNLI